MSSTQFYLLHQYYTKVYSVLQSDLRFRLRSSESESRDVGYGCGDLVTLLEQPADQRMMHTCTTPTISAPTPHTTRHTAIPFCQRMQITRLEQLADRFNNNNCRNNLLTRHSIILHRFLHQSSSSLSPNSSLAATILHIYAICNTTILY